MDLETFIRTLFGIGDDDLRYGVLRPECKMPETRAELRDRVNIISEEDFFDLLEAGYEWDCCSTIGLHVHVAYPPGGAQ